MRGVGGGVFWGRLPTVMLPRAKCVCASSRDAASWRKPHRRPSAEGPPAEVVLAPSTEVALAQVAALATSGDGVEARRQCAAALLRWPSNAHLHFIIGALCTAAGEHEQAEAHYRHAIELAPAHAPASCNLGRTLLARGAHAEAVAVLRRAVAAAPTLPEAHANLAAALRATGELAQAAAAAREAVRLAPHMPQALHVLAQLCLDCGDASEALELSWRAAAVAGAGGASTSGDVAGLAAAFALGARALEALGRCDEALAVLGKAAALQPGSAEAGMAAALRAELAWRALRTQLQPRPGDIFVASFPKSGTTWLQLVACMLCGEAATVSVHQRAPWLEAAVATGALSLAQLSAPPAQLGASRRISPRIFKTHAAWGGLPMVGCSERAPPPGVRALVAVRDPRDVCVSLYFHSRALKAVSYSGSWSTWLDLFLAGRAPLPMSGGGGGGGGAGGGGEAAAAAADWFAHVLSWWRIALACPQQVLLVSYEALRAAPTREIARIGAFLQPDENAAPDELAAEIAAATEFGAMKRRHEEGDGMAGAPLRHAGEAGHFRSGVAGDWRGHFSAAQRAQFESEVRCRLEGSGLLEQFPHWVEP